MDPLIDEKMVLSISAAVQEACHEYLGIMAVREAYGQTRNEGICHEFCIRQNFKMPTEGRLYLGMDGYSKLQLLPFAARRQRLEYLHPDAAEDALITFFRRTSELMNNEISEFLPEFELLELTLISHKVELLPVNEFRKYMIIFNMQEGQLQNYIGRIYIFLALKKF